MLTIGIVIGAVVVAPIATACIFHVILRWTLCSRGTVGVEVNK